MPTPISPDETQAAIFALKWLLGILGSIVTALFMALFGWVFKTDRAVQAAAAAAKAEAEAQAKDRQERRQWREEIVIWLRQIEQRVHAQELEAATERGKEIGRKERKEA